MKIALCPLFLLVAVSGLAFGQRDVAKGLQSSNQRPAIAADYGRLPLSFEANEGQTDPEVRFLTRGNGYDLFLTEDAAVLSLNRIDKSTAGALSKRVDPAAKSIQKDRVRMQLLGAAPSRRTEGLDRLPGTANYFIGNDPGKWRTNLPTYAKVKYTAVYPGIDLIYYGNQRQLEYDFVVAPEAATRQLRLRFDGASALRLNSEGDLIVAAKHGAMSFRKPVIYQLKDGQRQPVRGRFTLLAANTVGFSLGAYDHRRELVIDPVLAYATYLGGSLGDFPSAIAVDGSGNAYITGSTESTDFPVTKGAYATSLGSGYSSAFVTKLNATGTALVYSTYLGGAADDSGATSTAIAVDPTGAAYVAGTTYSSNFPVTSGAYQRAAGDDVGLFGASFLAKLNPSGSALVYSTYFGGNLPDFIYAVAVNSSGDAYVAGQAESSNFPVTQGVFQPNLGGTAGISANAFATRFNSSGSGLVYSTYLGGSNFDGATGAVLDSNENLYVTGKACSTDFPVTAGAVQMTNNAAATDSCNAFVSKINPTATALVYSTYLGGSVSDAANAIAVDPSDNCYVTGYSFSPDFPVTTGTIQTTNKAAANQESNVFVSKLNPAGDALIYSTYLGGSGFASANSQYIEYGEGDTGTGIAVDALGDAYITGAADSANFPVTSTGLQTTNRYAQEGKDGDAAAFLTEINPEGTVLLYSTYLAGSVGTGEEGYGIATDMYGNPYLAGLSSSSNFPVTTGAFQTTNKGVVPGGAVGYTGFVAKFAPPSDPKGVATSTAITPSVNPSPHRLPVNFTAYVTSGGTGISGTVSFAVDNGTPVNVALDDSGHAVYVADSLEVGTHVVSATYAGVANEYLASAATTSEIILPVTSRPTFTPAAGTYNLPVSVTLYSPTPGATIYYTTDGTTPTTASPKYSKAIEVSTTATIKAFALASGHAVSEIQSATYTIVPLPAAAPTFSPAPGTYTTEKYITLADKTPGAVIYYTLNGSTPTDKSTKYVDGFSLPATATVKAIAIAPNYLNSPVAAATYVILIHTTTALKSSPNPSVVGQTVTLTATVTAASGAVPTGTVTFVNAGVGAMGTATLKNGVATLTTSTLGQGIATINATYNTSATDLTSTSPNIKQVVNK
jgi:hypothetical protein